MTLLTSQQIFTTVARHLLTQGVAARDPDTHMCLFKMHDGRMCAIGCIIDPVYDRLTELGGPADLQTLDSMVREFPEVMASVGISEASVSLLDILREIHDTAAPETWYLRLSEFAVRWNLEMPEPVCA